MAPKTTMQAYSAEAGIRPAVTYPTGTQGGSVVLLTGVGVITCITFATAQVTTPALFYLRDGVDNTGEQIAVLGCPAGGGGAIAAGLPGIPFRRGLYLAHVTGNIVATITYIPLFNIPD